MEMSDMMPSAKQSLKSFWDKPEGKVGKWITIAALCGGFLFFYYKLLPVLIVMVQNTIMLGALLTVLFVLISPFFFKDIRLKLIVGYKLLLKRMASVIVRTDPIGILEYTISKGKERLEVFSDQMQKLKSVLRSLKDKIQTYSTQAKDNLATAQQAQQRGMTKDQMLSTRQAGRLKSAATELSDVYARLEALYRVITKIQENASFVLEDKEQEVNLMKDKWTAIKAAKSAMDSAMSVLKGSKDERALFEEAADYINDDLSTKIGEIEFMLESSETIMNNIDLQNGVFQQKGMDMLKEFEEKADKWLLLDPQQTNKSLADFNTNEVGQIQSKVVGSPNNFSSLFNK